MAGQRLHATEKAEILNRQFVSVFTKLITHPCTLLLTLAEIENKRIPPYEEMPAVNINPKGVDKLYCVTLN